MVRPNHVLVFASRPSPGGLRAGLGRGRAHRELRRRLYRPGRSMRGLTWDTRRNGYGAVFEQKKHLLCLALLVLDTLFLSGIVWALIAGAALPAYPFGLALGWEPNPRLAERLVFSVLTGAWAFRLHFSNYHANLLDLATGPSHGVSGSLPVLQGSCFFMLAGWLLRLPLLPFVARTASCTLCALAYVVFLSPIVSRVALSLLRRRGLATRVLLCARPCQTEKLLTSFVYPHSAILSPVGLLFTRTEAGETAPGIPGLTLLASTERAATCLVEAHVQAVVVADLSSDWPRESLVQRCLELGVPCWAVDPGSSGPGDESCPLTCRDLMASHRTPRRLLAKELLDVFVSMLMLICLALPMALIAALVRVTSGGPVLFRQERNGLYGKPFVMHKFRSMRVGSEVMHASLAAAEPGDILFKPENDPRVTCFGRFLRRSSLDELPQLWNVLKGDMSLVGPRPMPPYETDRLDGSRDRRRLCMKPGITGLWQVSGRSTVRTMRERVDLDLAYVEGWSLRRDLSILLKTIPTVLSARGAQ